MVQLCTTLAALVGTVCVSVHGGGGGRKKILGPAYTFFFGGYPRRGGGGYEKKIRVKIFSGPQNLKFP